MRERARCAEETKGMRVLTIKEAMRARHFSESSTREAKREMTVAVEEQ